MTEKEREASRLKQVAKEYELKGYKVTIQPSSRQLPSSLSDYSPDAVASSDAENVVIEVKSSSSIADSQYLTGLANSIEALPNWRLELVMTNPRESEKSRDPTQLLTNNEITQRMSSARQLAGDGHVDAATLMAWTAVESLLRRIAAAEGIRLKAENPRRLVKELYSRGELDESTFRTLDRAAKARNQIVHGFHSDRTSISDFEALASVTDRMVSESW